MGLLFQGGEGTHRNGTQFHRRMNLLGPLQYGGDLGTEYMNLFYTFASTPKTHHLQQFAQCVAHPIVEIN